MLFLGCNISWESEKQNSLSKNNNTEVKIIDIHQIDHIDFVKLGQPSCVKKIYDTENKDKVIKELSSIKLRKKINKHIKGFAYSITFIDKQSKNIQRFEFSNDKVCVSGTWYYCDKECRNIIEKLYSTLSTKAVVYKPGPFN